MLYYNNTVWVGFGIIAIFVPKLEHYLCNFKGAKTSYPFGPEALVYKI